MSTWGLTSGLAWEEPVKAFHAVVVLSALIASYASAQAATITFEIVSDGTFVGGAFPGLVFTNALVLTAEVSFNEDETPPKFKFAHNSSHFLA